MTCISPPPALVRCLLTWLLRPQRKAGRSRGAATRRSGRARARSPPGARSVRRGARRLLDLVLQARQPRRHVGAAGAPRAYGRPPPRGPGSRPAVRAGARVQRVAQEACGLVWSSAVIGAGLAAIIAQRCGPPRHCSRLTAPPAGIPIHMNELPQTQPAQHPGKRLRGARRTPTTRSVARCLESVRRHVPADSAPSRTFRPSAAAVNRALGQLAPADVVVLEEPCLRHAGWLERLRAAARATPTRRRASALAIGNRHSR